jgi:hypothetical protein
MVGEKKTNEKRRTRHAKMHLQTSANGKVALPPALRSTKASGPTKKGSTSRMLEKAAKITVQSTERAHGNAYMPATKSYADRELKGETHVSGTDIGKYTLTNNITAAVCVAQACVMGMAKLVPQEFYHSTSNLNVDAITPTDWAAYFVCCYLAAANRAKKLESSYANILNSFPEDSYVPYPIAELIRHTLELYGAPNVTRRILYDVDWTISTGQIVYNTAPGTELGNNQFGVETNLNQIECWPYAVINGSNADYVATPVPVNYNLIGAAGGRTSWYQTRFNIVQSYIAGLKVGKIELKRIALGTTNGSGFCGVESGRTWVDGKRILSPVANFNPDLAMFLNPNGGGQYYPGLSYAGGISTPTCAVQGGLYANNFNGSGSFYGQPVVPVAATRVGQSIQTLTHIMLSAEDFPRTVFGKNGYKYCGIEIQGLSRMVPVPIDVAGLTGKMVRAVTVTLSLSEGVAIPYGFINWVVHCAQASLVRKILSSGQFEWMASLNLDVISSSWNVQALIPSMEYINNELPLPWVNILDGIGATQYENTLFYPTFGQTLAQNWLTASGSAKYNLWPKFSTLSPGPALYPPICVPWNPTASGFASGEAQFPYAFLYNPSTALMAPTSYWYNDNTENTFMGVPKSIPLKSSAAIGAGSGVEISGIVTIENNYVLDASVQTAYSNALSASGSKETNVCFQYAGVGAGLSVLNMMFKLDTRSSKGMGVKPATKNPGSCSMLATLLGTVANGATREVDVVSFYTVNAQTVSQTTLSVTSGFLTNTYVQSNAFFSNTRIALAATLGLNTQYVVPGVTTPPQVTAYGKTAYAVRLLNKDSFDLWNEWCIECAQDGSATNAKIKKSLEKPHRHTQVEEMLVKAEPLTNASNGLFQGAMIDFCANNMNAYGGTQFSEKLLREAVVMAKLTGHPNQTIAAYKALSKSKTMYTSDDFSAASFFGGIKKGAEKGLSLVKTVLPYVPDVLEVAACFL